MRIGFMGGACCGAIAAYFFDPTMGRTRRTRTIDRIAGLLATRRARPGGRCAAWAPRRTA